MNETLSRKIKEERDIICNLERELHNVEIHSEECKDLLGEIEIVLIKHHSLLGQRNALIEFEDIKSIYSKSLSTNIKTKLN